MLKKINWKKSYKKHKVSIPDMQKGIPDFTMEDYDLMFPTEIEKGFYKNYLLNSVEHIIDNKSKDLQFYMDKYGSVGRNDGIHKYYSIFEELGIPEHGIVDNHKQFIRKYKKKLEESKYRVAVFFHDILKEHQPPKDGWRWHKWGDYLGTKKPKCEYLYDEDDSITQATIFQIYLF